MLIRTVAPTGSILSTAEAKTHIRQTFADVTEDAYIDSLVLAVTQEAEMYTNRAFLTQTWKLFLDWFPDCDTIDIPLGPIQSITHLKYYNEVGSLITMNPSLYQTDIISEPGRIKLSPGSFSWPSIQPDKANAVEIQFVAGYGAAAAVPEGIKRAVSLAVGSLYSNREDEITSSSVNKFDRTCERMLYPYRIFRFP